MPLTLQYSINNIYILAILVAYNFIPYFHFVLYRLLWLISVQFSASNIVKLFIDGVQIHSTQADKKNKQTNDKISMCH